MSVYRLSHLSDSQLETGLRSLARQDHLTTALLLAHLAESEQRRFHLAQGFDSLASYCARKLGYTEAAARKRVHAARIAREYPVLFERVAEGRMSVSSILALGPALSPANADELIEAASGLSRTEIEALLDARTPQTGLLEWGTSATEQDEAQEVPCANSCAPGRVVPSTPQEVVPAAAPAPVVAGGPARVALQLTVTAETQRKLLQAKDLLAHTEAGCDAARVLDRALDALLEKLLKRRAAITDKPRMPRCRGKNARTIPAHVRRAVWARDEARCAFVGEGGRRCACTRGLQFDHIVPLAKGGESTVANVRLLCRAHNQFEVERVFGRAFMEAKRNRDTGTAEPWRTDLAAALRTLGFRRDEIAAGERAASALAEHATSEARLRAALLVLQPRGTWKEKPVRETSPASHPEAGHEEAFAGTP